MTASVVSKHSPRTLAFLLLVATFGNGAVVSTDAYAQSWQAAGDKDDVAHPKRPAESTFDRLDQIKGSEWIDLTGLLDEIHHVTGVPGIAAAYVRDGEIVDQATVGVTAFGSSTELGHDACFHLGSVTKSMTGLLIGKLIEQGALAWETTVGEALPDLPMRDAYRNVSVEQLLRHQGGLASYTQGRPDGHDPEAKYEGSPTHRRAAFLADALQVTPTGTPGADFLYSNAGYALVGHMAEIATGQTWEDLMRSHLFEPLSMENSGFGFPEQPLGHVGTGPSFTSVPIEAYPEMEIIAPAGNVHASISDLAHYALAHLQGLQGQDGIASAETLRRLHTPPDRSTKSGYASGWRVDQRTDGSTVHHHGGTVGASFAEIRLFPETASGVVFLTSVSMGVGEAVANRVATEILQRFEGAPVGFVTADANPEGISLTLERASEADTDVFWKVITSLAQAINDEDRAGFHATLAPDYNRASADSLFDFMASQVLPSRGGIDSYHDASAPFRVDDSPTLTRTVTFHLENGYPGYLGIQLDTNHRITELSLFVKSDLCPNGADRSCGKITRKQDDAQ